MRKVQFKMELKPARLMAAVPSSETARMELRPEIRMEAAPIKTAAVKQVRNAQVRIVKTFLFLQFSIIESITYITRQRM